MIVYMTCKFHLGRVLSVGGSKLESLGKRGFEIRSFFSEVLSVLSSELWASLKRACPGAFGHSSLERVASEALSELKSCFWTEFTWASSKRTRPEATETWSLKRTSRRLSESCPVRPHLNFRFVYLWTNPNFPNVFLDLFNHYLCI